MSDEEGSYAEGDEDYEEEDDEDVFEGDEEDDEEKDSNRIDNDFLIEPEEDDDLTDFQKILNVQQKQGARTFNRLTKYERTAIIGFRAQQIAEGAPPYVEVGRLSDPSEIALKELQSGLLPLSIDRPLPSNKIGKFIYETRTLDELINVNLM